MKSLSPIITNLKGPGLFPLLFIAVVLIVLLAYSNWMTESTEQPYLVLSQAEALPLDIDLGELAGNESDWSAVSLPIHWRNQFSNTRAVWYRLQLDADQLSAVQTSAAENESLGLYIWRLNQTADIWFNKQPIGSGGSTDEPMARYWNSPLYFSFPRSLVKNNNEILIKHYSQHSWGSMEAIIVGGDSFLKPMYDNRHFIQHDIALGLFVFVLVTGAFCFCTWFYRRQEEQYLWFSIASVGLGFYCLNQFIRYLPFDADIWRWLSNMSTDLWASATFVFMLRSLGLHKPKAEKTILIYLLSGIPIYFYASFFQVFDINIYYHIGSFLIAIYSLYVSAGAYIQTRKALPAFYCFVIASLFAAGFHDTTMQAILNNGWQGSPAPSFQYHFNFLHFAAPILFLFIGASLIKGFIDSMNAADSLNEELEQRIDEARQELAENYQAIEKVLISQTANDERERIYRDLHDDVGSKLLSLYYRLDKESDSTLAKSALEDLRDIVSRKSMESCSLIESVQQWQSEAYNRTRDAGLLLTWNFDSSDTNLMLNESQQVQLRRMLREVLSNAILHGEKVTEIHVEIAVIDYHLTVSVINDGTSEPPDNWQAGRGISNLRVRSRDLNGEFSIIDMGDSWVKVFWKIPLDVAKRDNL